MRLLLDTHAFIWFFLGSTKLSIRARQLIEEQENLKLLSTASIWEMAIKHSIGKMSFGVAFRDFIEPRINLNDFSNLDINLDHIDVLSTLPLHHGDPFDRLIIAQSMVEEIPIISADSAFDAYSILRLW